MSLHVGFTSERARRLEELKAKYMTQPPPAASLAHQEISSTSSSSTSSSSTATTTSKTSSAQQHIATTHQSNTAVGSERPLPPPRQHAIPWLIDPLVKNIALALPDTHDVPYGVATTKEEKEDDATHITLNSVCISKCLHAIEVDSRREIKAVRCQFQNNVSSGVKIHMMSTGTFTDCVNHHNHIGYDIRESSHLTVQGDYSSIYKNTKYGIRCEELSLAVLKKNDVKTLLSVLNDNDDYYQHFIDNTNLTLDDLQNIDLESLMDIGLKRNHAKRVLLCVELVNEQGTHNGFHQVHSNGKIGCEERNNVSATKGSYCLTHQKYKVIRMYIDSKFQELPPTDVGWSFDEVHNHLLESHELVELDLVKLVISRMCAEGALYSTVDSEHFNSTI